MAGPSGRRVPARRRRHGSRGPRKPSTTVSRLKLRSRPERSDVSGPAGRERDRSPRAAASTAQSRYHPGPSRCSGRHPNTSSRPAPGWRCKEPEGPPTPPRTNPTCSRAGILDRVAADSPDRGHRSQGRAAPCGPLRQKQPAPPSSWPAPDSTAPPVVAAYCTSVRGAPSGEVGRFASGAPS